MPDKIGKYEISEQIGVGGFGAVYRARDPFIKRTVAIKTCQLNDEEIKNRFFREAELAGNLHHRNITTIYDFGIENGIPYIVQEFLTGEDLDKIVKRGEKIPIHRKIEILMAIADGLEYAHQSSVIHRDIKPSNIRILENGTVKIMDFGIAKSLLSESSLTQTGITLGTSAYLAPEQIRGEPLDQRTDIFALGILAYELLTYRKPFRGEHLSTVLYKILNESPEPIESVAPDIPIAVAGVVRRAMEKNIEERYPSMEAFRTALQSIYREIAGSTSRFATAPRQSRSAAPEQPGPFDSDQTIPTPSKGVAVTHITPPSGALARAPDREDQTPTVASRRHSVAPGLELVNFRDPSQRATERKPSDAEAPARKPRHSVRVGAAVLAVLATAAIGILLSRGRPVTAVRPAPKPVPTAPLVLPTPQLGQEPGGAPRVAEPAAAPAPSPRPAEPPAEPARVAAKEEPSRAPRKFPVQLSSLPMATLYVDGRRIGASIPVKTVELPEGNHTARFEHPDFPVHEKAFHVGPKGAAAIVYRFPMGFLVIDAPAWAGANVLIDLKFKGVLTGGKSFRMKSGSHKVTLSREGVTPYTANVTVPEGDKTTWTPPPPASRPDGAP